MATAKNPQRVVTGKVRFSFVNVFEPRPAQNEGEKEKYGACIIIPKKDKTTIQKIEAAIEAASELYATKFGGKLPANAKTPLRDGDEERPDDPAFANSYFLNANAIRKPGLVDADLNEILVRDEFYSGVYGRAALSFYPFNANRSKGIAAGLENIQKLADGERLGGAIVSAEDDFGDDLM